MVKLNLTDGENTIEMEGKAVVAFVIDPANDDSDGASMMLGKVNPERAMISVAKGAAGLITQLFSNPIDQCMLGVRMNQIIKDVICGESDSEIEVVKNEIKRPDEEHD